MTGLKQKVMGGERVLGAMVFECMTPGVAQIMAGAGCEYLLYDMEHAAVSFDQLKAQTAACRGVLTPLARVPVGERHFITRALDIGVQGIMAPMVDSVAEAEAIVEACLYPPEGRRGAGFGFAHDGYDASDPLATMRRANRDTLVIAQIETERGLAHVDAIAATEGIDVLWIGQNDLSNFLGVPGQLDHKIYLEACETIIAAARRNNKAMGVLATSPASAAGYAAEGYEMIAAGTDQLILQRGVAQILEGAK